jgi:hypothetical protein
VKIDRVQIRLLDGGQHPGEHPQNHGITLGGFGRIAIMQQQNVARFQVLEQPLADLVRIGFPGIKTSPGPTGQLQSQTAQYRLEERIANPEWRSEEQRRRSTSS